jgi:hypothetical protein
MNELKSVLIWTLAFLLFSQYATTAEVSKAEISEGEKLERQMWADFKAKKWVEVESKIASDFQSVHEDGVRDREAEIKLIKGLNVGEYTLNNFKVTQNGPAIIVTYTASVQEIIAGENLDKQSERLSVWIKTDKGWQWITHANLVPLKN